MSFEHLQQNFANATGLIVDRTVDPPLILGQAFVVSKSRAVTCASCVFQYTEAPWALTINFPHPDLALGLKAIALHPDFDKKEARTRYLGQTGSLEDQGSAQLNDLATMVLDAQLMELQPERVGELHRALTLPFSNAGVEASGVVKDSDIVGLVTTVLDSRREGLLTFYDQFNIPIARVQIAGDGVKKVYYNNLVNEMAFSELVYRKPAKGFAFQPSATFKWATPQEVSVPAANLMSESQRRSAELPSLLARLGGAQARYQRSLEHFDSQSANENIRWLIERLWTTLDGFISVDRLAEKIGADTYSIVQGLKELINRGVVSLINRATPFACGGRLGDPLVSHTDFDINPGDPLMAFWLDPASGAPVWQQGNFSGVSSVLQPKNLLHTIPIPPKTLGALILKNYKLIGVHNGLVQPKPGQAPSGEKLSQMMWIGALLDMGTKRLRGTEAADGSRQEAGLATLRSRSDEETAPAAAARMEKLICPQCYSTNTKAGPCFNCGTIIEAPEPVAEPTGLEKVKQYASFEYLQERFGLTKQQLIIGAAIVVGLPLFGMMFCSSPPPEQTPTNQPDQNIPTAHHTSHEAVELASQNAGFKGTAPPGYWYEDTAKLTKPAKSFALYSDTSNQNVLFVLFDDMSPVLALPNFIHRPLFTNVKGPYPGTVGEKFESGSQIVGADTLNYFVGHYEEPDDPNLEKPPKNVLIGSFPAIAGKKSFLVIAQALRPNTTYDYKSTLWLIDQMAEEETAKGNEKRFAHVGIKLPKTGGTTTEPEKETPEKVTYATDDEIDAFVKTAQEKLQNKLALSDELQETLQKKKTKKLKVTMTVGIGNDGSVKTLELTEPSDNEKLNHALEKDITSCAPYADAPKTEKGVLKLLVSLNRDKLKVELP
jgi:hypothetical protein